MGKKEQLQAALKDAMRSGNDLQKSTIRMAISAIRLAEIDNKKELDDLAVIAILQKEVKGREEAIADAKKAGRSDLEQEALSEIEVLKKFLPEPLDENQLRDLASQAIAEAGATSIKEMGQVMKILVPRLEGRATGNQASQMVRELLS